MLFSGKSTWKMGLFLQPMRSPFCAIRMLISHSAVKGIQMVNMFATCRRQFLKKWVVFSESYYDFQFYISSMNSISSSGEKIVFASKNINVTSTYWGALHLTYHFVFLIYWLCAAGWFERHFKVYIIMLVWYAVVNLCKPLMTFNANVCLSFIIYGTYAFHASCY